jgi:cytoskeletal protein CcmA (bactofilin family)
MRKSILVACCGIYLFAFMAPPIAASEGNRRAINGSVEVGPGERAGSVSTVNGSVRIGAKAIVGAASTVNGSIELAADAAAESLRTVNGEMELASNAKVIENVSSVNGSLRLAPGAEVGGSVSNVNGEIRIDGATINGRIRTVAGDIELRGPARVRGGIHIEKPRGWGGGGSKSRPPRIVIGPQAVVEGELTFEREVELFVSDTAKIGKVVGTTAKRFNGERP